MLLIGAKFAKIVKVDETIEDGLRTGNIACVASQVGFLGLLRKEKEDVSFISHPYDKRTKISFGFSFRKSSPSKVYTLALQNPYLIFYVQPDYQTHPSNL